MTDQEKDARIEDLRSEIADQQIEFARTSGAVRYHLEIGARAQLVMWLACVSVFWAMFIAWIPLLSLHSLLCLMLLVAVFWNIHHRSSVTRFHLYRQSEAVQKLDDLVWEHAKLTGQEHLLNFLRAGFMHLPPRFD